MIKKSLIPIFFVVSFLYAKTCLSQCTLTIKQIGVKSDTTFVANYDESQQPKQINDSTCVFLYDSIAADRIFVFLNRKTRWVKRVWMEPSIKSKTLIVNYDKKTAVLLNPTEWDVITEKWSKLLNSDMQYASDSIGSNYINKNPSSYLSLYFISHGLYNDNPIQKLAALNLITPTFKDYPEYKQTKASLTKRKYPKTGDSFAEFELQNSKGGTFTSSTINGKWILLNFWSNNCAPCLREMDDLVKIYKSLDTSKIQFISIALDDKIETWKNSKYLKKMLWTSVWQPDNLYGYLCLQYNLTAMPFFVLFDVDKKIYLIKEGSSELQTIKNVLIEKNLSSKNK